MSAPGRVIRQNGEYRIVGAVWGAPIQCVEVQIDGGAWVPATIDRSQDAEFTWKFWVFGVGTLSAGRAHHGLPSYRYGREHPTSDERSSYRQEAHLLGEQRPSYATNSYRLTYRIALGRQFHLLHAPSSGGLRARGLPGLLLLVPFGLVPPLIQINASVTEGLGPAKAHENHAELRLHWLGAVRSNKEWRKLRPC